MMWIIVSHSAQGLVKALGGGGHKGKTITTAVFTDQLCRVKQLLLFFLNLEGAHVGFWQEISCARAKIPHLIV